MVSSMFAGKMTPYQLVQVRLVPAAQKDQLAAVAGVVDAILHGTAAEDVADGHAHDAGT